MRWKEIRPRLLTLLNDKKATRYEDEDLLLWWNNGQERLAVTKPQTRHQLYKRDDGNPRPVPALHYKPVAIFFGDSEPLQRLPTNLALLDDVASHFDFSS